MNQKQRDFLISHVKRRAKLQLEEHNKKKPTPPSLNNYVVAAILDGSFEIKSNGEIHSAIKEKALRLGPGDTLIASEDNWSGRRRRHGDEEREVTLDVEEIFILPQAYIVERKKYDEALKVWQAEADEIEEISETLELKLQIGSDESLSKLIGQADNLADVRLINRQLLLEGKS